MIFDSLYELFINPLSINYGMTGNLQPSGVRDIRRDAYEAGMGLRRTELPRVAPRQKRQLRIQPFVFAALSSLGVFGGISSLFVGLVFVLIHTIVPADRMFDRTGTGLLIAGIPLILIGSIFIDMIEKKGD